MNEELTRYSARLVSNYIELFATILIAVTIVIIILNNVVHLLRSNEASFKLWKSRGWRGIQGGLDLFVAADLLSTISIDRTFNSVVTLGLLLVVRSFVSWSIEMESDGCWPWQKKKFELLEKQNGNK
jgi:uncharacterized membrane protein